MSNVAAQQPSSVDPTTPVWERPVLVRACIAAAIGTTVVYLTWRIMDTRGSVPLWLFASLATLEVWTLFRLVFDARVLWTVPNNERPDLTEIISTDIIVTCFHEPVHVVRATLLGCNAVTYPHSTFLIDDAGRPEMAELASELGVQYAQRSETDGARAGAINFGLGMSTAELVLLLEADQVPLPDALHATVGYFADNHVAVVQTPMEYLNRDSILHSSPDRHERSFPNEVVGPARDHLGGALWEGSASLIRRVAFASVGGIATHSTTGELQTTVRLHSLGWATKYHSEPIVQGLAPHNLAAFLRQRERWARGHLGVLRTEDDPLRKPGLFREQRWCFTQLLLEYFQAPIDLAYYGILLIVLWTGTIPFEASATELVAFWLPAFACRSLAAVAMSRGRLRVGETIARRMLMLEIHLKALVATVVSASRRFDPVAKTGTDEGGLDVIEHLKLLTLLTLGLEVALGLRMLDALIGWPLDSMRGLSLITAVVAGGTVLWLSLQVLGVFVRRRQHRSFYRVGTDMGGYVDGNLVKVRDITPAGVGFITPHRFEPGARVHVRVRIPDARGGATTLDLQAIIRNQIPNQLGNRYRVGCRFVALTPDELNLITEYSSVVRPYQLLRKQKVLAS